MESIFVLGRVIVCGDRKWKDRKRLFSVLTDLHNTIGPFHLIIEGEADGADKMSAEWANKWGVPVSQHPAEWDKYGRKAGPIRNNEMLKNYPDKVIAFHNDIGNSKGTRDMINKARKARIGVILVTDTSITFM